MAVDMRIVLSVVRILLSVVRILLLSGRWIGVVSPVVGIRLSPVSVPLSGVRRLIAVVPVLLRIPVSVFSSVRVLDGVGPGVTPVFHDDPSTQDQPPSCCSHKPDAVKVQLPLPHRFTEAHTTGADKRLCMITRG